MSKKIIAALCSLVFLSASCNVFGPTSVAGVAKTVNGGVDWQFSNAIKDNENATLQGVNISRMAFDPSRRETVYAGSYIEGLYKSEDSGASWVRILSKIAVFDVVVNPYDTKKIYVAGYYNGFGKALVTPDGGATWQEIYNEESKENPVRAIVLNPSDPRQVIIGTAAGNIVRSVDEGVNWQLVRDFDSRINRMQWRNGLIYALVESKGLFVMPESGGEFADLTHDLTAGGYNQSLEQRVQGFSQMAIDPGNSNVIYVTTTRGLYRSTDAGKTWNYLQLPVNPEAANTRAIAVAPTSSSVLYTSIGSTVYKSTDSGASWQTQKISTTGFINFILIDPSLPQIAYTGLYSQ